MPTAEYAITSSPTSNDPTDPCTLPSLSVVISNNLGTIIGLWESNIAYTGVNEVNPDPLNWVFLDLINSSSPEEINWFLNQVSVFEIVTESLSLSLNLIVSLKSLVVVVVSTSTLVLDPPPVRVWFLVSSVLVWIVPRFKFCLPNLNLRLIFSVLFDPVTCMVSAFENCSVLLQKSTSGDKTTLPERAGCSNGFTFSISVAFVCVIHSTSS